MRVEEKDPNHFSQEYLYGENLDDIMKYLNMDNSELVGENASEFQIIIHKHVEEAWISKKTQMPSFGEGFEWVNVNKPLSFVEDLGQKVYVFDFFTYCCINCIHILPILKKVEEEFARNPGFSVIGAHSPKFPNEKDLDKVKAAVIRNDIKHPVLNDPKSKLWMTCGVRCWPTVFIVGPAHTLLFVLVGETQIEKLSFLCHHILKYFESCAVELDSCPIPTIQLTEPEQKEAGLLFPGNISSNGYKIVVSDTGHNRLLLMSSCLTVEETIGSGNSGFDDGPFNSASFNSPHGTAWYNNAIYVADTGNHRIRKVDLLQKIVTTVFKSEDYTYIDNNEYAKTSFSSPWDVCIGPKFGSVLQVLNTLYIAVAGSHQIWIMDLEADPSRLGFCRPFAGSGKEENRQNLYKFKAGFAQPSGIAYSPLSPAHLFVADSESSTIKSVALEGGRVQTIVGGGRDPTDLFQFGDEDGSHVDVKLQHPMGVCVINKKKLAIADTYNHKIKIVDVKEKTCKTLKTDEIFCEPSAICLHQDVLYVADTNNHRIVSLPLDEEILDVCPEEAIETFNLFLLDPPNTTIALGFKGKVYCHFKIEENPYYEMNESGSQKYNVSFKGNARFAVTCHNNKVFGSYQPSMKIIHDSIEDVPFGGDVSSEVTLTVIVPLCDKQLKVCSFKEMTYKFIINVSKYGPKVAYLNLNTKVD